MDPDGTIYYILSLAISFILCLYTAAIIKLEDEDHRLGAPDGVFSAFLLFVADMYLLFTRALPCFAFPVCLLLGALFVITATVLPFCLGLALPEKLEGLVKVLSPVIGLLNHTVTLLVLLPTKAIFRLFKLDTDDDVTPQDVMDLVEDADEDVIDDDQKEMIENIFELEETKAGDIMTHRTETYAINGSEKCADVIDEAIESGFSRIPVYENTIDTVLGFLYTKDLLSVVGDDEKMQQPVRDFVRKAMYVPEACGARELLVQFKKNRTQIAIVVDEYGGTSGIVTMEDILEEIVGNIQDEYDNEEELYVENEDGSYTCQAIMEMDELLDLFDIEKDEDEEDEGFDSIGGLIIDRLGRIPTQEEQPQVEYKGLVFTVLEVADRRIIKVSVAPAVMVETEE